MSPEFPRRCQRLQFRPLRPADLPAFFAYRSDPVVARYQGWEPMDEPAARAFLVDAAGFSRFVPGSWRQLAIARIDDDGLIGDLGVHLSADASEAEFGLSLAREHQGAGLGTEAIAGVIAWLFEATPVQRILADADVRNLPCVHALQRAGMTQVGQREGIYKGEACREWCFRIARDER